MHFKVRSDIHVVQNERDGHLLPTITLIKPTITFKKSQAQCGHYI